MRRRGVGVADAQFGEVHAVKRLRVAGAEYVDDLEAVRFGAFGELPHEA